MPKCGTYLSFRLKPKGRDQFAQTDDGLLKEFQELYGKFDFDPCPVNPKFDGLEVDWGQNNYVNPPFNAMEKWLTKAVTEWLKGNKQIIFLLPVNRLCNMYFIRIIYPYTVKGEIDVYIIPGRLKFKDYKQSSPFGLVYLHFKEKSLNEGLSGF